MMEDVSGAERQPDHNSQSACRNIRSNTYFTHSFGMDFEMWSEPPVILFFRQDGADGDDKTCGPAPRCSGDTRTSDRRVITASGRLRAKPGRQGRIRSTSRHDDRCGQHVLWTSANGCHKTRRKDGDRPKSIRDLDSPVYVVVRVFLRLSQCKVRTE